MKKLILGTIAVVGAGLIIKEIVENRKVDKMISNINEKINNDIEEINRNYREGVRMANERIRQSEQRMNEHSEFGKKLDEGLDRVMEELNSDGPIIFE